MVPVTAGNFGIDVFCAAKQKQQERASTPRSKEEQRQRQKCEFIWRRALKISYP
jgi:hypothetical protein